MQQQAKAYDLWLDCWSEREIAKQLGVSQPTIGEWVERKTTDVANLSAPASRQDFDIWNFQATDRDGGGQQSS
jgi:uncharacterized protein YjcR